MSSLNMVHNFDPQDDLDKRSYREYRSGVFMLSWLVKNSSSDIANYVCELSNVLESYYNKDDTILLIYTLYAISYDTQYSMYCT